MCSERWTRFYDRDNPSGKGDYKTLPYLRNENQGQICHNPTALDAKLVGTHIGYTQTGKNLKVDSRRGFWCSNTQNETKAIWIAKFGFAVPTSITRL